MGPQLYRCGNIPRALAPQGKGPTFNGAATLSLRKLANPGMFWGIVLILQWGRNFIVAETVELKDNLEAVTGLQWGRNFIVAETR